MHSSISCCNDEGVCDRRIDEYCQDDEPRFMSRWAGRKRDGRNDIPASQRETMTGQVDTYQFMLVCPPGTLEPGTWYTGTRYFPLSGCRY